MPFETMRGARKGGLSHQRYIERRTHGKLSLFEAEKNASEDSEK